MPQEPNTLRQWKEYIKGLDNSDIRKKSRAANKWQFVKELKEVEGYKPEEITAILYFFAKEMDNRDMPIPGVGDNRYVSFRQLLIDHDNSEMQKLFE